jgi:hypothetical protein
MSKVYGSDKIRRTCLIKGREPEGRFGLLRKNVNVSKVLASGTEGEGEEVDTGLVYDERIAPRPPRVTSKPADSEAKTYPADKALRRVCFLEGHGDQKFHLLRKGAELSKVLQVGVEGQGTWVNTSEIRDEHMVPVPIKARVIERKPVRICKLAEDANPGQEYLVLRKTSKGARLVPVYENNYGITVDPTRLLDETTINQAKKPKRKKGEEQVTDGDQTGQTPIDGTVTEQPAAPAQPVQAQPAPAAAVAQPAPAAAVAQPQRPAPAAPAQTQRPAAAVGQPQRPAPVQPQRPAPAAPAGQRPQPVGAAVGGAPRPAQPQGRPQGR